MLCTDGGPRNVLRGKAVVTDPMEEEASSMHQMAVT